MRALLSSLLLLLAVLCGPLPATRADKESQDESEDKNEDEYEEASDEPEVIGYFAAEPGWLWARRHGALIMTVGGVLDLVPDNPLTTARRVAGGVEGQMLMAPHRFPLLFGIGAGSLYLERNRRVVRGPWKWTRQHDAIFPVFDDWTYSRETTTTNRSLQLRHVEALVRLQPYWGVVRPYVEGAIGVGILWDGLKLDGELKNATRSTAVLYGATLGVDLQLAPKNNQNLHLFIISLGIRRLWTGGLERTTYRASAAGDVTAVTARGKLALWTPTVSLGFAF